MKSDEKVDIWIPFYIGDYLGKTMHLTTEQHGAYFLLILAYWKNRGPLPNDDVRLSGIARMTIDAWSIAKAVLIEFFDTKKIPGMLVHNKIESELKKATDKRKMLKNRAKTAANARWGKAK